jgi:hypothetical protein
VDEMTSELYKQTLRREKYFRLGEERRELCGKDLGRVEF